MSSFDPASLHIIQRLEDLETNLHQAIRSNSSQGPSDAQTYTTVPDQPLDRLYLLPCQPERLYDVAELESSSNGLASLSRSPERCAVSPTLSNQLRVVDADLDGPTCKRLLDHFFAYVHVKNPILQEDETRRLAHQTSMSGLDWRPQSCLVLLICALGATATPFGPSHDVAFGTDSYMLGEAYFKAAQKRLGPCLVDGGLLGAQCLFLAGVYLMTNFRPYDSWRLFSQSLACCQGFEFDTPTAGPYDSPIDTHQSPIEAAKQSIYWSAWKSEREIRAAFEMRDFPTKSETLYPFFFPTPPTSSPEATSIDDTQTRERRGWYYYLTEISLHRLYRRTASAALHETSRPGQSIYQALAEALPSKKQDIEDWLHALPSPMSLDSDAADDDVLRFILRGHLHNYYEMIYWPFVASAIFPDAHKTQPTTQSHDSTQVTLLRELAETGLSLHVERIRINAPGFAHRHHGTWGLIRACTRSALVLLKAAKVASDGGALSMPPEWLAAVREVMQLNQYWQREVTDSRQHLSVLEKAVEGL